MAKTPHHAFLPLAAASALVVIAAGYLGYVSVATIRLPTAADRVRRAPAMPVTRSLPRNAATFDLAPEVKPVVVPHILVSSIPRDLATIQDTSERKDIFIRMVLPLVLEVNARIEQDRSHLLILRARTDSGHVLTPREQDWLDRIMRQYRVTDLDWDALLRRVDTVPPSLAIAQAANESAWGTSRFAQEGNALFGQWVWSDNGMIPQARGEDEIHSVRRFATPLASVMAYVRNLNTHPFYKRFRMLRDEIREASESRPGYLLAGTLDAYSTRRDAYVEELRQIIRVNDLQALNSAVFGAGQDHLALNVAK
jgi:Bax protein